MTHVRDAAGNCGERKEHLVRGISSVVVVASLVLLTPVDVLAGTDPPFLSEAEREAALEAVFPLGGHVPGTEAQWTMKARFEDPTLRTDLFLTLSKTNDDNYVLDIAWAVGEDIYTQVRRARPRDAADAARVARGLVVRRIRASAARSEDLARLGAALEALNVPALPRYFDVSDPSVTEIALDYYTGNSLRVKWLGAGVAYDDVPLMRWLTDLRRVALKEIAAAH